MKYIIFSLLFLLALTGYAIDKPVFKIVSYPDSKPLKNHRVLLYNGDVKFKMRRGDNPYPYNPKTENKWLLDELKTDENGLLKFIKTYKCHSIIFVFGEEYKNFYISFSDNLSHNFLQEHIRVCDFIEDTTKVKGNFIYDIKKKEVTYIPIEGEKTIKKFKNIPIKVIKKVK